MHSTQVARPDLARTKKTNLSQHLGLGGTFCHDYNTRNMFSIEAELSLEIWQSGNRFSWSRH